MSDGVERKWRYPTRPDPTSTACVGGEGEARRSETREENCTTSWSFFGVTCAFPGVKRSPFASDT